MILTSPRVQLDFLGFPLENPFLLSASPSTDELSITRRGLDAGWAGAILKTTSLPTTQVNLAYPMMSAWSSDSGILGMGNIDLISVYHVKEVCRRVKLLKSEFPNKLIAASIMSDSKDGWQTLVRLLKESGVDLIECSFSCPQGSLGEDPGKMLAQSESATEQVASWVKEAAGDLPVLIKITPLVTDVVAIVKAVMRAGCDGVTASNSFPALMGIDLKRLIPIPSVGGYSSYSGYSGPAIKPITLRVVAEIASNVPNVVISGNGGISDWRDSAEIIALGASTVQICTAVMLHGFGIIEDLVAGLDRYLEEQSFRSVRELIRRALPKIVPHERLPRLKFKSFVVKEKCIGCGRCYVVCRDGGHEAMKWDAALRLPEVDSEKCVGCGLCLLTQPVAGCLQLIEQT